MALFNFRCNDDLSLGTNVDVKAVENYFPSHFPAVLLCSSVFTVRKKTRLP